MNCKKFETTILELARDPGAVADEPAIAHLQSCPQCAGELSDQRSLTSGLKALGWNTRSAAAPPRVEAELWAAFRQAAARSGVATVAPIRTRRSFLPAFAAAAMVIIAVGAASYFRHRPATDYTAANLASQTDAGEGSGQNITPLENHHQPDDRGSAHAGTSDGNGRRHVKASHRAVRTREEVARFESSDAATDFVPVIYGSDPTPLEGGQILRVRLSRSALASLGLPVNVEHPDETLMADVMLGEDGLARSIRLVESKERSPQD